MNAITIYRKRSLAVVPFVRIKISIVAQIEQVRLAIATFCQALNTFTDAVGHAIAALDEFACQYSWSMIDEKRNHKMRWLWFRLLQRLGIN